MGIRITKSPVIKKGTHYWSCAGVNFKPDNPPDFDYYYDHEKGDIIITTAAGDEAILAPVFLLNGAVITGAIVEGSDVTNTWFLYRRKIDGSANEDTLATANVDTEDTSISNATVDNSLYYYHLKVLLYNGDIIHGARITYTL